MDVETSEIGEYLFRCFLRRVCDYLSSSGHRCAHGNHLVEKRDQLARTICRHPPQDSQGLYSDGYVVRAPFPVQRVEVRMDITYVIHFLILVSALTSM